MPSHSNYLSFIYPTILFLVFTVAHHKLKGEQLISWAPDFHPFSSININTIVK